MTFKVSKEKAEKMLEDFIRNEKEKVLTGSGDDGFYAEQISEYVNKQRAFWISSIQTFVQIGKNIKEAKR